jgi:hypothetical protein
MDYTKSSFLLQGGGVLRAKKSPDIPPKPPLQDGLNWLAARSWRSTCIGSAVLTHFDCMRPWRSTGIPPQKSTIFLCTNGAQHRIWHLADLIPQHRNIALILSSLIPNTRPPSADPESRRVPPKTASKTTQDSHRDCISHHHRQHHSFALFSRLHQMSV